jgi:hypothetical protein
MADVFTVLAAADKARDAVTGRGAGCTSKEEPKGRSTMTKAQLIEILRDH